MAKKWILKFEDEPAGKDSLGIYLGVQEAKSDNSVRLIAPCDTLDAFQKEISHLIDELNDLSTKAREKIESLERETGTGEAFDAAGVWQEMEGCATEADMFALFNSYGEPQRQEIAEYVLTHVNMFKGRGPVFSEHYDSATHSLE